MMKQIAINAILTGALTSIGLITVELAKYNIWYAPIISAVLMGIAVGIRCYLDNRKNKSVGAKPKMKKFKVCPVIGIT